MAPPFAHLTLTDFARVLERLPITRRIVALHLHHTWHPSHRDFRGHETLVAIWRYQTQVQGWGDIAQHLTIDPQGVIWTGRNWSQPPVSAAGHNGNQAAGPFAITLIGNFDHGQDRWEGEQRRVALAAIVLVQQRFQLAPETLHFHSQLSSKSCPGAALDYSKIVEELRQLHAAPPQLAARPTGDPNTAPFDATALADHALIQAFSRDRPMRDDPADAEPEEDTMLGGQLQALFNVEAEGGAARPASGSQRAAPLPPQTINFLRPYVVNLTLGRFSMAGAMTTTPGDIDAIFDDYLVRALEGAQARGEPLRLLFWAHGGLVSETNGLRASAYHAVWWRRNNVYPIYFVWETGLFETIGQILRRSRQLGREITRDIFDFTTDPLVERLVRSLYAPRIWSGMKRSAELAVAEDGGARYVAKRLKRFCDAHPEVELHAAGHSAGSIFLAHFLPAALDLGVPAFRTTHFLAPAIRMDAFQNRLAKRLGKGIDRIAIFTMNNARERDDDCAGIYRKSLLYLIYHALEPEARTPILGLEICLRNDRQVGDLFGLGTAASDKGEVIFSDTTLTSGRSASKAVHHGDFDNDPPTMNSVARRVLGASDIDPIANFPTDATGVRGLSSWDNQIDWPTDLEPILTIPEPASPPALAPPSLALQLPAIAPMIPGSSVGQANGDGRKRALCVGIDVYTEAPLYGCVADAQEWQRTLQGLGFNEIETLINQQATYEAILAALERFVMRSVAGDVLVFQFAGHGAQLPDTGNDEANGDTPDQDEAICPIDYPSGAFVIDDDIGAIFQRIPPGVNLTCFIDCCHSGTISRFGVGVPASGAASRLGPRPRFIVPNTELVVAHRRFRQARASRYGGATRGMSEMREVLFAACLSSEVAYEENGHGDFTTRATQLLQAGFVGLTNEQFEQQVTARFGSTPRQHPRLYCHPSARSVGLLQPLAGGPATGAGRTLHAAPSSTGQGATAADLLRIAAALLERRS